MFKIRDSIESLGLGLACEVDASGLDSCLRLMATYPDMPPLLRHMLVIFYLRPNNKNRDLMDKLGKLSATEFVDAAEPLSGFIRMEALSMDDGAGVLWADPCENGRLEGFATDGKSFRDAIKKKSSNTISLVVVFRYGVDHVYNVGGRSAQQITLGSPFMEMHVPRTYHAAFLRLQRGYACIKRCASRDKELAVRTHVRRLFEYPFPDGVRIVERALADVTKFLRGHVVMQDGKASFHYYECLLAAGNTDEANLGQFMTEALRCAFRHSGKYKDMGICPSSRTSITLYQRGTVLLSDVLSYGTATATGVVAPAPVTNGTVVTTSGQASTVSNGKIRPWVRTTQQTDLAKHLAGVSDGQVKKSAEANDNVNSSQQTGLTKHLTGVNNEQVVKSVEMNGNVDVTSSPLATDTAASIAPSPSETVSQYATRVYDAAPPTDDDKLKPILVRLWSELPARGRTKLVSKLTDQQLMDTGTYVYTNILPNEIKSAIMYAVVNEQSARETQQQKSEQ
uniref:Uncharacterized protein n=1 Tax=viral metagenome TaxID=1070528 RepID=A0A2V0RB82_9ZZZZ